LSHAVNIPKVRIFVCLVNSQFRYPRHVFIWRHIHVITKSRSCLRRSPTGSTLRIKHKINWYLQVLLHQKNRVDPTFL
jgi:hypothetical protein